jgi:serine/threonine protein kinase
MANRRIASQVSQTKIGGYPILEKIGKGGMGTVYKGQNLQPRQFVAIKVLAGGVAASEVMRLRFAQECQIARQLDHPHIVRVLDFGLDGNKPFLVMEYVDGESLGERLHREGKLPEAEAVRLIVQVGRALHWAHQRKLIHRDVKPDNILIGADGNAKLTDLGLVKNLDSDFNLTQTQSSLGTPNFMAPEQFEDARRAEPRSDLYSLAATLYMTITGELPFSGRSTKAVATIYKKKLANEITAPSQLVPGLSAGVEAAILKGLRAERKERHASVHEFVECLRAQSAAPASVAEEPKPIVKKGKERRKKRYATRRGSRCRPLQRVPDMSWSGQVLNISEGGLCLELGRRYEPGALLTIVLNGQETSRHSLVARVMWVRKDGREKWTMGCQFDQPLCEFEVAALV